jgi:hypothetical protein
MEEKRINLFYSWQSDIDKDTNLNAIRNSLRLCCTEVENQIPNLNINLEEATSNLPGSPNIPYSIIEKISNSDIFVCDITTINSECICNVKRTPNPNVLIELGFAISTLGWNRIILLYNTNYGKFPDDLPFDIDRHRATNYAVSNKADKQGKDKLTETLIIAVKLIIEKNPQKSNEINNLSAEELKRKNDIEQLTRFLNSIHIETFDYFISRMPKNIYSKIFYYEAGVYDLTNSSTFYIYDTKLKEYIDTLIKYWHNLLMSSTYYHQEPNGQDYYYKMPADTFVSEDSEKEFHRLTKLTLDTEKLFKEFICYVRENYVEINLLETNRTAFDDYTQYHKR